MLGTADGLRVGILGGNVDNPTDDTNPNWTTGGGQAGRNALLTDERVITRAINYLDEQRGLTSAAVTTFQTRLNDVVGEEFFGGADETEFQAIGSNLIQAVASLISGGVVGARYEHQQTAPATVWNVQHDLDQQIVSVQVVNGNTTMIPEVAFVDDDNLVLTFAQARNGTAIIRR